MIICELNAENEWSGELQVVADDAICPAGWVAALPPSVPADRVACWINGRWAIRRSQVSDLIDAECARIDAERDRRQALDFRFDFGETPAVLDDGSIVPAHDRALQMGGRNKRDWMAQQGRALVAVQAGAEDVIILVRASDNANLLVPPAQFLETFEAGAERDQNLMIYAAQRKTLVRAQTSSAGVVATRQVTDAGWPP